MNDKERRSRKPRGTGRKDRPEKEHDGGNKIVTKKPIILAKPPPRKIVNDNEEEWPSIADAAATNSASTSPTRKPLFPQIVQKTDESQVNHTLRNLRQNEDAASDRMAKTKPSPEATGQTKPVHIMQNPNATPTVVVNASKSVSGVTAPTTVLAGTGMKKVNLQWPECKIASNSVRIISDNMEWCGDSIQDYLCEWSTEFLVIGVIGGQGAGKSTIASFLAGNESEDAYRNYIFRPASKEAVETSSHQTTGAFFYATEGRIIILDSQAFMSPSVLDALIQYEKHYPGDYQPDNYSENCMELESLQLTSFLLHVCHIVLVVLDDFIDLAFARFLQNCEMLKPSNIGLEEAAQVEHFPHVGRFCTASLDSAVNFSLLPYVNFWLKHKFPDKEGFKCHETFEQLMDRLKCQLFACPRKMISHGIVNEKAWYHFAAKTWDSVRSSVLVRDFGRKLP